MKFNKSNSEYSILVIEDIFSKSEIRSILDECSNIYKHVGFDEPEKTGSAKYADGTSRKKNSGIFIDELFSGRGRNISSILRIIENKIFSIETIEQYESLNPFNSLIKNCNSHTTLLNYYEDNNYYDYHHDSSAFSVVSIFHEEPKHFSGGDLIFMIDNKEIRIETKNNMSIIFPSSYLHKVSPISFNGKLENGKLMGRFSIVQLLFIHNIV